jgi:demethylmenaquinone methyltransferase / 2-methoxy-6-polyprenyl-1,4-benzoquinol methylase
VIGRSGDRVKGLSGNTVQSARTTTDDLPQGSAKTRMVRAMFDTIAPRYDLVNRIMSLGLDRSWRRRTVQALGLAPGSVVVDLACGTGDLTRACLAQGYLGIGVDFSTGMLAANRAPAPLVQADAADLPFLEGTVDAVVCAYGLRNFTDLPRVVAEAARVLRPGGRLALLEVGAPPSRLVHAGYTVWFEHVVPVIGGLLSDADAYRYLPRSTAYLPPAHELQRLLAGKGFATVGHRMLQGGLSQLFTATRVGLPPGAT